jgi:hypothetical protein
MRFPSFKRKPGKPKNSENSIGLRVVTSAIALTGAVAVYNVVDSTDPTTVLVSIVGIVFGSIVSYYRRDSDNFWIKVGISWGILLVAGLFFHDLAMRIRASISDARIPLTNMLVALQALHCFDLPRRRDLNLSAIVGLALIASTSTLSRNNEFAIYVVLFMVLGAVMLYLDCMSRTRSFVKTDRTPSFMQRRSTAEVVSRVYGLSGGVLSFFKQIAPLAVVLPCVAFLVFLVLPRADITVLRHVSLAAKFDLPFIQGGDIVNHGLDNRQMRGDGSIKVNPRAYFGFAEDLDLNYRGELSQEIVMRVNSSSGQLWRAMAFDTFDGRHWTMSKPHHTTDRVAGYNSRIYLYLLPSFLVNKKYCRERLLTQTFYIESNQPNLIPVASIPENLYFPAQFIKVDDYGSLRSIKELESDTVYTVSEGALPITSSCRIVSATRRLLVWRQRSWVLRKTTGMEKRKKFPFTCRTIINTI